MVSSQTSARSSHGPIIAAAAAAVFAATVAFAASSNAHAQQAFTAPESAAEALVKAAQAKDTKALLRVLGKDGEDIVSSGDPVADASTRQRFLAAYDAKHQVRVNKDNATLILGEDDFPFPIPLVRHRGMWRFDTVAGRDEILARRVGRNELDTIQTCLAYVDAQNEYAEKDRTGAGAGIYAQRVISRPGNKDGLYWPSAAPDDQSPLGDLVAQASTQGYRAGSERIPYHGYYFKILTRQGGSAPGGAMNYVVRGKMIGGFALVAWPADYRNSGVMTFLVNHQGTVFQKDLGPRTSRFAPRISSFNPDRTWNKADSPAPGR